MTIDNIKHIMKTVCVIHLLRFGLRKCKGLRGLNSSLTWELTNGLSPPQKDIRFDENPTTFLNIRKSLDIILKLFI